MAARPWITAVNSFGLDCVRMELDAKTEAIVENSPLRMPALKSWRYVLTTVVALGFGCGVVVLGRAVAPPPQAASPLMMSATRRASRASSFAFRAYVFIGFSVLSAIGLTLTLQPISSLPWRASSLLAHPPP